MSALTVSGIILVLTLGGILLGTLLRRTLPRDHPNEHAKDVVRLGVGLIVSGAEQCRELNCRELNLTSPIVVNII